VKFRRRDRHQPLIVASRPSAVRSPQSAWYQTLGEGPAGESFSPSGVWCDGALPWISVSWRESCGHIAPVPIPIPVSIHGARYLPRSRSRSSSPRPDRQVLAHRKT